MYGSEGRTSRGGRAPAVASLGRSTAGGQNPDAPFLQRLTDICSLVRAPLLSRVRVAPVNHVVAAPQMFLVCERNPRTSGCSISRANPSPLSQ